ncbi:MAG TPA: hypothetical protein VMR28_00590 [Candidatus Saccharimonadales bacterium]|nr:hypothetical protein [Candidatus Saccharimonadales bacterium]
MEILILEDWQARQRELAQKAEIQLKQATERLHQAVSLGDEEEMAHHRDIYMIMTGVLGRRTQASGKERAEQWRDYAVDRYEQVTGAVLEEATKPLSWWRRQERQIGGIRFTEIDAGDISDIALTDMLSSLEES